ncbi:hypothetical protein K3495_g15084 [Podosphaera aphanis]|nr:hypothetical protein K3495_g15084 [Podosphaera aphanis]
MTAAVNNPENLGRKSPFISTLKPPPQTWKQMIRHSESDGFIKAAKIEWQTLGDKETFNIITDERALELQRIHQINSLPLKWVFTYKQDKEGRLSKHKARKCVRGDLHRTTRDTFAATLYSARCCECIFKQQAGRSCCLRVSARLRNCGKKCLLKRALYRLPRSPLLWAQTVEKELENLGFEEVQDVDCLMFDEKLMKTLQMRECEPDRFLGIRIIRNRLEKKIMLPKHRLHSPPHMIKALTLNVQIAITQLLDSSMSINQKLDQ